MTGRRPPEPVAAAARDAGLGSPLDGWGTRSDWLVRGVAFPIAFGLFALVFLNLRPHLLGWPLAVVAVSVGLYSAVTSWRRRRGAVWVFEGGVVTGTGGGHDTLLFRDLTDVRESQETGRIAGLGSEYPTIRTVELLRGGTVVRRYRGQIGTGSDRIGDAVVTAFHRPTTQRLRDGVAAGQAVDLGAFTFSTEGLHHPDGLLPWSTFEQVKVAQGSVFFVRRRGGEVVHPFHAVRGGSAALEVVVEAHTAGSRPDGR